MSSTLDRLRRLNRLRPQRGPVLPEETATDHRLPSRSGMDQGQVVLNELGECFIATHAYPLESTRGDSPLRSLLDHSPRPLDRVHPDFHLSTVDNFRSAAFLDTETTGLGTGASVYAFMVGIGTFEAISDDTAIDPPVADEVTPTHFVVRQIFMRNPAEELALIYEFVSQLAHRQLLVTFNGRSFDIPLLRARVRYNRPFLSENLLDVPLLQHDAPHLDLLLPARRLWRRRLESCRLAHLEEAILHHERTDSDVPGYLIPQLYAHFVRTGEPEQMDRVFYHNREDIVSMVSLANELSLAFDRQNDREQSGGLQGQDWLSLGVTYERMRDWAQAEPAYLRALEDTESQADRSEVFSRLGRLQKRQGRWQAAAETWQLWLTSVPGNDPAPYVELAKYHEWQLKDYEQAKMYTAWALHNLRQEDSAFAWTRTIDELEHRLQRIRRKLEK